MKLSHTLFAVVALAALAAALAAGCKKETPAPASMQATEIAQKVCPVTGNPIDPNVYVDYQGRRVYFCCQACPPIFNKDPEKYIAIMHEQMKSGAKPAEAAPMPIPMKGQGGS